MKQFIKSVLLFSVFTILFYGFTILITGKIVPRSLYGNLLAENKISSRDGSKRRFLEAKTSKNVDVLILGSSHAYRGYDTRLFKKQGFSSYNLGSSAQRLNLTELIYDENINKLKPKILIIDIYPYFFDEGIEGTVNLIPLKYHDNDFRLFVLKSLNSMTINSLLYFNFFGNVDKVKDPIKKEEKYIEGGYISTFKTAKNFKKYKSSRLVIKDDNIMALRNIVTDAERQGIKVFLFQAPLPENYYKSFTNNKEIDSLMRSIGRYYNYNEEKYLPVSYFFDDSHINQKGVDVYNKWVIEKIKENE